MSKIKLVVGYVQNKINKISPVILWLILLIIFLLPLFGYNHDVMTGDMAEYLNNPVRVLNGELPYRDFWLLFPPGEVLLPALIYRVFGLNINILLVFSVLINALMGTIAFFVGRNIFKDNFFAMISALLVFKVITHYQGYFYMYMYFWLLLLSLFYFIKYLHSNYLQELFLSGIVVGCALLFRIHEVGAGLLSFLLIIVIHSKYNKTFLRETLKHIFVFLSGVLVIVFFSSLALIEIWQPMVKELLIEGISHGTSMNLPYFFDLIQSSKSLITQVKTGFTEVQFLFLFIINLIKLIKNAIFYLLPFFLLAVSTWYLMDKKVKGNEKLVILLFLMWGLFTFPKGLGRADLPHISLVIAPLVYLLVFLLQKSILEIKSRGRFIAYALSAITFILLITVAGLFRPIRTLIAKPPYKIVSPYGVLLLYDKTEADNINAVIRFINENTKQEDYIFVTPWFAPPFYALTNRKNPTYYDSLIDPVVRPSIEKQKEICEDLLNKRTALVIHYPYWGFDNKKELQFLISCPILQKCIEDNFTLTEKYGSFWIYVRKNYR